MSTEELARADQLVALGVPLDQGVLESIRLKHCGLVLSQETFFCPAIIFDLPHERTGVAVTIGIHVLHRVIRLEHAVIDIPWNLGFSWLEDPWRKRPREHAYWFPAPSNEGYERERVLNHFFQRHSKLYPGTLYEGTLLGIGEGAIPERFHDGQRHQTHLSIFDSRGVQYKLDVNLIIEREPKPKPKHIQHNKPRRQLIVRDPAVEADNPK